MGFEQIKPKIYLSVIDGKITQRFKAPNANTTTRKTKDGVEVYEIYHDAFNGYIVDIFRKENEYNGKKIKSLAIVIEDGDAEYELSLPWLSRLATSFWMAMPNVDFTKPVRISPWLDTIKDRTSMYLERGDMAPRSKEGRYDWAWTKDNPGDLPPMEKIEVNGEETWDSGKQLKFLMDKLQNEWLPKIKEAKKERDANKKQEAVSSESIEIVEEHAETFQENEPEDFRSPEEIAADSKALVDSMKAENAQTTVPNKENRLSTEKDDLPF